jgi:ABC-2 type transport system ATP-binding protein
MPPAIQIEQLTKDFGVGFWRTRPRRALDALTLDVAPGEVFGFLGPNGAGKTTTLKLLVQLLYPTSGRAAILGRPAGDLEVRRRIGFLPEQPYFYEYLTAEELLEYFGSLFGYPSRERRVRTARVLDEVGVATERRLPLRKLSKGMIQRVGIAQAIVNDPEVLFLDEPMSGLDPLGRREMRALVLRLRDRGCTVFFSSHILSDAEALCERVGILAGGRLVAAGQIANMLACNVRGWELVVSGVAFEALAAFASRVTRMTRITEDRHTLELSRATAPEPLIADLASAGARIVSLTPLHPTLEEYFVEQVTRHGAGDRPS